MKPTLGINGKLLLAILALGLMIGGGSLAAHLTSADKSQPKQDEPAQIAAAKSAPRRPRRRRLHLRQPI